MKALTAFAVTSWLMITCSIASAHTSGASFLSVQSAGAHVTAELDFDLRDLHQQLQLDQDQDGAIDWGEIRSAQSAIETLALTQTQFSSGGHPCSITKLESIAIAEHGTGPYARLGVSMNCEPGALQVDHTGWFIFDPGHRALLAYTNDAGQESQSILSQASPRWRAAESHGVRLQRFLIEGAVHLVTGYDHLTFLAVLLLALVRRRQDVAPSLIDMLRRALVVITAFTVAHSVTLALAATGFLALPSKPVEIVIAASVVIAALLNLWRHAGAHGWKLAFAFGLVHGLGFAGALAELTSESIDLLALTAFNVGIETAQIAIAAVTVPLIWWVFRGARSERIGVPLVSIAIAGIAAFWVINRVAAT